MRVIPALLVAVALAGSDASAPGGGAGALRRREG